jgi:hypothetical protein
MYRSILFILVLAGGLQAQEITPAQYWESLSDSEKVAFVNGAYAMAARLKAHHEHEVYQQYYRDPNWIQPYYIERFYEIVDEHISKEVGTHLEIITQSMDALYANYDNHRIPIIEALRIVSVAQDGDRAKGNLLLLQAQRKYRP